MTWRHREVLDEYRELAVVAVAAVLGLTVQSPLLWVVHHQGIDVLLVVLVFSTAIGIEPGSLRRLTASWRQLFLALVVGASLLPALSWLVSNMVAPGALRNGIATIGLAPCEIASIATTAIAAGDVALAGGVLIGSTMVTVLVAGPILAFESPGTSVNPGNLIVNLLVIVAIPLAAGLTVRLLTPLPAPGEAVASTTSTLAVAGLVALVAAEVHPSRNYLAVLLAALVIVVGSAIVGRITALGSGQRTIKTLLLTTSMRDFAIAAALASDAFGPAAAAPLGVYGITVLIWGTGSAGFMRARHAEPGR